MEHVAQNGGLAADGKSAGADDRAHKEDVIENDHDLAEGILAEGGLDKGAVVGGALAAGKLHHVEHHAAGEQHGEQGHQQADHAVLLIILGGENAGSKAGAEVAAQPDRGYTNERRGKNTFFLHSCSLSFRFLLMVEGGPADEGVFQIAGHLQVQGMGQVGLEELLPVQVDDRHDVGIGIALDAASEHPGLMEEGQGFVKLLIGLAHALLHGVQIGARSELEQNIMGQMATPLSNRFAAVYSRAGTAASDGFTILQKQSCGK